MTNKEAIDDLKFIKETNILQNLHMGNEALDLAIKALQFAEEVIKITIEEDFPEYTDDRIRDLVDKEYNED